ncbi:MAG TPA: PAS domain-containing sensor histidine kinase, partial [Chroococcales cyanobacterium]
LSSLVYKDDLESTLAALQAIMEGQGKESFETRVTKRDGAVIDMLWSATWSAAERKVFCVARDITERKAAERLRQDVVQMVSHDLRSPLATIESFHEMLEQGILGDLNERGQKLLHIADRNSQRMLALIDDLLDIEKMEAGALELHKSDVPLSAIFEQSIHAVFAWSKEKDVALDYEPTELTVFADGDRLVQVLVNLLSNAVKFSPRGRAVTLLARQLPQAVEIDVIDRGRGIPAHMLGSIFDRFKQVRESDAREKRGTGLGLAICKALVALHEGTIRVQSAEGEGTVFTVHLPQ